MIVEKAKLDLAVEVARAELERQSQDEANWQSPYLYPAIGDDTDFQGIDGVVDLRALARAILTNGGAP